MNIHREKHAHLDNANPTSADIQQTSTPCPACAGKTTTEFFTANNQPVNVGVFFDTRDAAINAPRGNIALVYCHDCGFVHNRMLDSTADIFKPGYEVALHHSQTFRTFIQGVAERLVERFDLHQKRIVEIGCGDGYFLRTLANTGGNNCIGIDPTVASEGERAVESGSVRLIRDYFGPKYQEIDTDFVCCLSVFEDIPRPTGFLAALHALTSRTGAPIYFETFNAWRAFEQQEVWSAHYEQCNYFSLDSLKQIFVRNGFDVDAAAHCYQGGQYLFVEASPSQSEPAIPSSPLTTDVPSVLTDFTEAHDRQRADWVRRFAQYRDENKKVVVWGSGGKGITFLNAVPGADIIEYVAEINRDKQGKFVPGSGQKIVPPEFLATYRPDKIIITNVLYETEMKAQAAKLGVTAEFLVA